MKSLRYEAQLLEAQVQLLEQEVRSLVGYHFSRWERKDVARHIMLLRSSLNNLEARELADWLYIATDRDKGYEVELAFFRAYVSALETLPLARGNPKTSGLQTAVSELVKRYRPHWSAEKTGKIAEYSLEKVGLFSRYEPDTHDDIRPAEKGYEVLLAFYRAYFSATSGKQKREGIRLGKRKAA